MSDIAIRVDGLSKQYYIGSRQEQSDRFGDQLAELFLSPFRRARKLLYGQVTGAAELDESFWALQDLSFDIQRGDVVGVIGHNGAGKSTLLKVLSRITEPTHGFAQVYGRVGSLLEVGTGFHPELSGRENIYLNGAILGMQKAEIDYKFDDIIAFAEIEKFLDTPVKHYSSGMYVRLAFAVAAHLEPEILLVDEVLAVGDLAFQKKCLGKMDNVSRQGRTIIFVSHNMNAMQRLCPKSILLEHGQLIQYGNTSEVIEKYLSSSTGNMNPAEWLDVSSIQRERSGKAHLERFSFSSRNKSIGYHLYSDGPAEFKLDIFSNAPRDIASIAITLYDRYGTKLVNADSRMIDEKISLQKGHNEIGFNIDNLHLNPGIYTLGVWIADPPSESHDVLPSIAQIEVVEFLPDKGSVRVDGVVTCKFEITK